MRQTTSWGNPFSWKNLSYPIILCPPMDGITDMAYRELVSEMGGSAVRYCEFINVKGLIYQNPKTIFELRFTEKQHPIIAQLFGNHPDDFYEASKLIVRMGFDAIDINMGCPSHKVAGKGCGCALMDNTENAVNIVKATIEGANSERLVKHSHKSSSKLTDSNTPFEVTTKMRLGINEKDRIFSHGMAMIEAGSKAVAIHGRTLKQMYTGEADWEPIKTFKELVIAKYGINSEAPKIFGSGDVKSLWEAFVRIITTGVDGVMIGRGSFGNPWVFDKEKVERLRTLCIENGWPKTVEHIEEISSWEKIKNELENKEVRFEKIKEVVIRHAELMVQDKGEKGIIQMRKHLGWYFTGFPGAKELRGELVRVDTLEEMKRILDANFT